LEEFLEITLIEEWVDEQRVVIGVKAGGSDGVDVVVLKAEGETALPQHHIHLVRTGLVCT